MTRYSASDIMAQTIERYGCVTIVDLDVAEKEYERLKAIFPAIKIVKGVRPYGIGQALYLPGSEKRLVRDTIGYISSSETYIWRWKAALQQLLPSPFSLKAFRHRLNVPLYRIRYVWIYRNIPKLAWQFFKATLKDLVFVVFATYTPFQK